MSQPLPPDSGSTPPPVGYYSAAGVSGLNWQDLMSFKTMITVPVIKVLFIVGIVVCVLSGLATILMGLINITHGGFYLIFIGLVDLVVGPFLVRIYCELLMVIFRINETLLEIKNELSRR